MQVSRTEAEGLQLEKRKEWLMSVNQFEAFNKNRQLHYKNICSAHQLQAFPDDFLTKYYTWNICLFLRTRADRPFKLEKVIFTAACLFKRYFLVNSFMDEEPMQMCICSMYIALKLNSYTTDYIDRMVLAWRGKAVLEPKMGHLHYGDQGYSEKEFKLLSGIGFQTVRSKILCTVQSLYGKLTETQEKTPVELLPVIKKHLLNYYIDASLMFLADGCQVGLCIFLVALEKLKFTVDFQKVFGEKFVQMLNNKKDQLEALKEKVNKLEIYDQHSVKENNTEFYLKLTRTHYKKPDFKKSPKFHSRHESMTE